MRFSGQATFDPHAELRVLPFWEGPVDASGFSAKVPSDFKGKSGETLVLYGEGRTLLLGLGPREAANAETLRRAYAAAVRFAQSKKIQSMQVALPHMEGALRGVAEGIFLTNYLFTQLKGDPAKDGPSLVGQVAFIGVSDQEALKKWSAIADGVRVARDLVNGNADDVTPKMLAETALSLEASARGLKATILDRKQLEKEKMGLLLAVNRGSVQDPYLITLGYKGHPKSDAHIVLIGKGVTYDTGGLCLKTPDNMLTQKGDMSGAAAVLLAVHTAAVLGLKVNVTAVAPVVENAIGSRSYKLGDVFRSMSGKTVEVTNNDAEGRLILADALSYTLKYLRPTQMVDIATLTGGIIVAIGEDVAGLFCNDEKLSKDLCAAADASGEALWKMPLVSEYREALKSDIADMINSAGRTASPVTAALFLQEFAGGSIPWAHIDAAGPCFVTKPKHYNTAKGTGYGVRLFVEFLERHSHS